MLKSGKRAGNFFSPLLVIMPDWFIAFIVLIGVCALGVYYVNGFHGLVPEGFFDLSGVLGIYYLNGGNQSVPEGFYSSPPPSADADDQQKAIHQVNAEIPKEVLEDTAPPLSLDKRLTDFVSSIKNTNMIVPNEKQLNTIQGNVKVYSEDNASNYKPHQEIIKPHMTPRVVNPTSTGKVASDAGTQAETIREKEMTTPSIREMVRDDAKKNSFNENEISY